ncbi:MbtH family protein [Melghirimyces algeriensis]|uniref:MbtH protein n=1 Tax=Melghirimyces algeriensis TaxID=910412 RepID=A0A521EXR5_9BACL|nr:MbtH family protein [Melghirimyces algeriensis]SMO88201.1 MbtH protein [Melghirimyces algeriensis]
MTNPFEDQESTYLVLMNEEGQYSIWPADIDVPPGWSIVFTENTRESCIEYIYSHWTDLKPHSLRK